MPSLLLSLLLLVQNLNPGPVPTPEVAKFTAFTPSTVQMDIGTSAHCTVWSKLPGQWLTEVACYTTSSATPSKLELIQVQVNNTTGMYGSFAYSGGSFTWSIVQGAWSFQACPLNGVTLVKTGMF